jgi:hypothetical protein
MTLLTKRFQQWARKNKKFSSKGSGSRGSGSKNKKEEQNRCFNITRKLVTSLLIVLSSLPYLLYLIVQSMKILYCDPVQ